MRCPCRKKSETIAYLDCCQPYHAGQAAPTAEALMRSRYSAFVMEDAAYLSTTWHASTRPAHIGFAPDQEWLLLRIAGGRADGDKATVAFTARSRIGGQSNVLQETSRFVRENERWYYLDGAVE